MQNTKVNIDESGEVGRPLRELECGDVFRFTNNDKSEGWMMMTDEEAGSDTHAVVSLKNGIVWYRSGDCFVVPARRVEIEVTI